MDVSRKWAAESRGNTLCRLWGLERSLEESGDRWDAESRSSRNVAVCPAATTPIGIHEREIPRVFFVSCHFASDLA